MALLEKFGTLNGIMNASVEDLSRVEGISLALAQRIKDYLQENL